MLQIAYNVSRVEYTIVPALTLINNILMLLIDIIERLHSIIIRYRNRSKNDNQTLQYTNSNESSTTNLANSGNPRMEQL
jgi:hypothetical protein